MTDIPREYRLWPCPDPDSCPDRRLSGHGLYYCARATVVLDARYADATSEQIDACGARIQALRAEEG